MEVQLKLEKRNREGAIDALEKQARYDAADASQWRSLQAKNWFQKIASIVGPMAMIGLGFAFPVAAPLLGRASGWLAKAVTPKAPGFFGVAPTSTLDSQIVMAANMKRNIAALVEHNKTLPPDQQVSINPERLVAMYMDEFNKTTDTSDQKIIAHREENVVDAEVHPVNVANLIAKLGA